MILNLGWTDEMSPDLDVDIHEEHGGQSDEPDWMVAVNGRVSKPGDGDLHANEDNAVGWFELAASDTLTRDRQCREGPRAGRAKPAANPDLVARSHLQYTVNRP